MEGLLIDVEEHRESSAYEIKFYSSHFSKVFQLFRTDIITVGGVVGATSLNPGFGRVFQVREGFPDCTGNWKFWQSFGGFFCKYRIDHHSEPIPGIHDGGIQGGACFRVEYQANRILFSSDSQVKGAWAETRTPGTSRGFSPCS